GFACANIITSRNPGIDIMALSTKGSLNNIRLLKEREVKLAIVQSDIFFYAINKMKKFTDEDHSDLRALLSLFPEVVQIVLPADAKINSIKDLKGKRVILGSKGSGNLSTALAVLSCFDIDETNITPGYLSYDGAISSMENREFDAFFLVAGLPTKVYRELEKRMDLKILTLDTAEVKTICDKYNYFSSTSIPAGT
ncbi:TAXI family TRAP transporter solute-binding subunit, partial [bacterium]|nr:TAXI family TRAP transporter solute-binding subunit [bacterium]